MGQLMNQMPRLPEVSKKAVSGLKRLIEYISARGYTEGQRLPSIKDLSEILGLGTHAVRDALLQAQTIGLVKVTPRSGAYVQRVDLSCLVDALADALPRSVMRDEHSLLDLLEARRVIELELVAVAAVRRRLADLEPLRESIQRMYAEVEDYAEYLRQNETFHLGIARTAGNRVLEVVLTRFLELLRVDLAAREPATWKDLVSRKREIDVQEHEAIFAALLAGDPAAAREAMLAHLKDTTDTLIPGGSGRRADS